MSDQTLRHELEVMDVKAAFHSALAETDAFTIAHFSTWPQLHEFYATRPGHGTDILVKPDGFIRIHEKEPDGALYERIFFLEVDRSTEKQDILVDRAACYVDYYQSGGFAVRNGATAVDVKSFPFRVLIVLKSAERRNNTAERLLQNNPPILTLTWLATLEEVTSDPLGAIWIQPKAYRDVTAGTPFDTERKLPSGVYRRQAEREAFVEGRIAKKKLLES